MKSFIIYIKHRTGLNDATDFNLVKEYGDFFAKITNITKDKNINPEGVPDIDKVAQLTKEEWTELEIEFNAIHSEHKAELQKALLALKSNNA